MPMWADAQLQPKRKPAAKRAAKKSALKASTIPTDGAISLDGETVRAWLASAADILCARPKVGDVSPTAPVGPRLEEALALPALLLLLPVAAPCAGKRPALCPVLAALFPRPTKKRRATEPASPAAAPSPQPGSDIEAFRDEAASPHRGLPSPLGPLGRPSDAAAGRRSGLSGGSGSALERALGAAPSPRSLKGGRGRMSDGLGGAALREGDLPEADDAFYGGRGEEYDAPLPDEEEAAGGFGAWEGEKGPSVPWESLPETGPEASQRRPPAAQLSGVSIGVATYFAGAFGTPEAPRSVKLGDLCATHGLNRTQVAQLFAQVLILSTASYVKVEQRKPYAAIYLARGAVPIPVAA